MRSGSRGRVGRVRHEIRCARVHTRGGWAETRAYRARCGAEVACTKAPARARNRSGVVVNDRYEMRIACVYVRSVVAAHRAWL